MTPATEARIRAAFAAAADAVLEALREEAHARPSTPRLLTIAETCEALGGITRSMFYERVLRPGLLKPIRLGGRVFLSESAIADLIADAAEPGRERGRGGQAA